jgi:hypothetical protein
VSTILPALIDHTERHRHRLAGRPAATFVIATAGRFCREDRYGSRWVEFLAGEVWPICRFLTGPEYPKPAPTRQSINALIQTFVCMTEVLRRGCLVSGRWGTRSANLSVARAIRMLASRGAPPGEYAYWSGLRLLCASLCFYWSLAGSIARNDFTTLATFMHVPIRTNGNERPAVSTLPLLALKSIDWRLVQGFETRLMAASEFLFRVLQGEFIDAAVDPAAAEDLFDHLELLISLEFAHLRLRQLADSVVTPWFWMPLGRFIGEHGSQGLIRRLAPYRDLPGDHPLLRAGLLGSSPESATRAVEAIVQSLEGGQATNILTT